MQTKLQSLKETLTDIAIGYVINFTANFVILPLAGFAVPTLGQGFAVSVMFTVLALARRYVTRRWFASKETNMEYSAYHNQRGICRDCVNIFCSHKERGTYCANQLREMEAKHKEK